LSPGLTFGGILLTTGEKNMFGGKEKVLFEKMVSEPQRLEK
jgi:hypothetical protein